MKVIIILPAYNASKTLKPFLRQLPKDIVDGIILVDDCSKDRTYEMASQIKQLGVYKTQYNLGYGGNLKMCLSLALEKGADVIIELHPDGEYGFDGITPALKEIKKGAVFVLGNRFSNGMPKGMFWWKYCVTQILTWLCNRILKTNLPDLHQGFRVYTKKLLETIPYRENSNNYLFSFEIITQAVFNKLYIASVPVTAIYKGKKRGASLTSSIDYTIGTLKVLHDFINAKKKKRNSLFEKPIKVIPVCLFCQTNFFMTRREKKEKFVVFYCMQCEIGMTNPLPKDMSSYYDESYWNPNGMMGVLRDIAFRLFQRRRVVAIKQFLEKGEILDVGSGEGEFGKQLSSSYQVTNLEARFSKVTNTHVFKTDFLTWKTTKRFDGIVFWESLEHVPHALKYLEKATKRLEKGGYLFIEYPRYQSSESRIFLSHWFHLDMPRHMFHFTDRGMERLFPHLGLQIVSDTRTLALEYTPWGLFASILSVFGFSDKKLRVPGSILVTLILLSLLGLSTFGALSFFFLNESPIRLIVVRKMK